MECFTAEYSQFCTTDIKICLLGGRLNTCPSVPRNSEIFLKFADLLRSSVLIRCTACETACIINL